MDHLKGSREPLRVLQAGRGLAAIAVVLFHIQAAIFVLPKYFGLTISRWLEPGHAGVEFFFVLSGFIITYIHRDQIGSSDALWSFARRRFFRIYPVYWIVATVVLTSVLAVPHWEAAQNKGIFSLLGTITLLPIYPGSLVGAGWTLQHEVMFYFMFAAIVCNRRAGLALFSMWMLGSLAILFVRSRPDLAGALLELIFNPIHILFLMGMGTAFVLKRVRIRYAPMWCALGLLTFAGAGIGDVLIGPGIQSDPAFVLLYGAASTICIAGFVQLEKDKRIRVAAFFVYLGDASYAIYITHMTFLSAMAKTIHRLHPGDLTFAPLIFVGMFFAAVIAGIAFHETIERPLLRYFAKKTNISRSTPVWIEANLEHPEGNSGEGQAGGDERADDPFVHAAGNDFQLLCSPIEVRNL